MALELFYTFNNQDSKDYSENGLNGTDTTLTYTAGDIGYNAVFNGVSDAISHGTFDVLGSGTSAGFYLRIKFAATTGTKYVLFKNGQYYATYDGTTFTFSVVGATGTTSVSTTVSTGQYYQIHVNYIYTEVSSYMRLYLDGTLADSGSSQGVIVSNSNIAYVGGDAGLGLVDTANFELNEYKIYSNVLTTDNIANHLTNINGLNVYITRSVFSLGDILCSKVTESNKGYATVCYINGNLIGIQPLNAYVSSSDSFVRVGNLFDTDRQYSISINKDSIDFYNGVSLSIEAFTSDKLVYSLTSEGIIYTSTTKTANYTATNNDKLIYLDSSGGSFTITLPASPTTNKIITLMDKSGNLESYNVTIDGNGKNINGNSTALMTRNYESWDLIYNGTQWNLK